MQVLLDRRLLVTSLTLMMTVILTGPEIGMAQQSSVFLMQRLKQTDDFVPRQICDPEGPRSQSFDLAVVEFADDGSFSQPTQFSQLVACVQTAVARPNPNILVALFVHGWRHNSTWGDEHFVEFRRTMQRLALREVEGRTGRRVFGIYIGWPGGNFLDLFNPSYERALRIGRGTDFKRMLATVIEITRKATKSSIVLFMGHSLGAAMLEAGLGNLLNDTMAAPYGSGGVAPPPSCTSFTGVARPELLPDLVLLLAPASEASLTQEIIGKIWGKISKKVTCAPNPFESPLVVYVAPDSDIVTGFWFRLRRGGKRTAGNVDHLVTHEFALDGPPNSITGQSCRAEPSLEDFEQSWHCLRQPKLSGLMISQMTMDLPRIQDPQDPCHQRYIAQLNPRFTGSGIPPFWIVQVPEDIVSGHSDIFNQRSSLMAMGLLQMSGATVGIWERYSDMFEPDRGPCTFRTFH